MRFQVQIPPTTFRLDSRITQRIRQWVPNRRNGDWKKPAVAKCAAAKHRNIQFATAGRTELLAVGNFGDWRAAVGEVPSPLCQRSSETLCFTRRCFTRHKHDVTCWSTLVLLDGDCYVLPYTECHPVCIGAGQSTAYNVTVNCFIIRTRRTDRH